MTDKELRKLSRADLIEIIYELQKREAKAKKTIDELNQKLEDKEIRIQQSGSIAEASLKIHDVFTAAQAAADQYLLSLHAANENAEKQISRTEQVCRRALLAAKQQAEDILRDAESQKKQILAEAQAEADQKTEEFYSRAKQLIETQEALYDLLKREH